MFRNLLLLIALCAAVPSFAWNDSLRVELSVDASAASNDNLRPMWSYSNAWGRYAQYSQTEALAFAKATYHIHSGSLFQLQAGLGVQGSSADDMTMLHEAYLRGRLWVFNFSAGLDAYSPIATNNGLSAGSYIMSDNARPLPRVGLGIFDYVTLPYTYNLLQVRGGIYVGRMGNEDNPQYTDDILLHEKFAYARIGRWFAKPYVGLAHSVMMGGKLTDGREMPTDFWASFVGKGSDKFTGDFRGEATNAAGAHQGMWHMGFDIELPALTANVYYQRPFADSRAWGFFQMDSRDLTLGANVSLAYGKWLKAVNVEYINTKWQGGLGTPDPVLPDKNGNTIYIWPGDVTEENIDAWLDANVIPEHLQAWETEHGEITSVIEAIDFIREVYGHGEEYGGRSQYLTNFFYPQGWTVRGLSMGMPLFHTIKTANAYGAQTPGRVIFSNVRLRAVNVAAEGSLTPNLSYRVKLTFSRNYGNYVEQYLGAYSWQLTSDYFYTKPKNQNYTALWLNYAIGPKLSVNGCAAYDFGDLYNSFALRLGVKYSISCF